MKPAQQRNSLQFVALIYSQTSCSLKKFPSSFGRIADVVENPTAELSARQRNETIPWNTAPRFLILNARVLSIFEKFLRVLNIHNLRTVPRSPWQNVSVERVIGKIRCECLDHLIVLSEHRLNRIRRPYANYYNRHRTHLSDTPAPHPANRYTVGQIVAFPEVVGLHH